MNAMKMSITLLLVIVLFVYDVYCPGFYLPGMGVYRPRTSENEENEENVLPTFYPLYGCESHSSSLTLNWPSSEYELVCDEDTPSVCSLTERSLTSGIATLYSFRKAEVKFISMMEEEINFILKVLPSRVDSNVTAYFRSNALAQQFYKLITQNRPFELVPIIASADHVKNSDNAVLAEPAIIYLEREAPNRKVVVKNGAGDTVLMFRKNAIAGKRQHEDSPTRTDLYVNSRTRSRVTYEFRFSTPAQASNLIRSLD